MSTRLRTVPTSSGPDLDRLIPDEPPLDGAACVGAEQPDDWYGGPDATTHNNGGITRAHRAAETRARRVCAGCPAAADCLERALDRGDLWGMFGGLTADERRTARQPKKGGGPELAAGLVEIGRYGGDPDALIDVISRHRTRAAA